MMSPPSAASRGRKCGGMTRQCYVLIAGFGLSIPLFFVTTDAWLLWVIVPLLAGQASRLRRRHGRGLGGRQTLR
jgi:hypothetical protein